MKPSLKLKMQRMRCIACPPWSNKTVEVCHIRSKGAGGCDEEWNLYPGCVEHHRLQHRIGIVTFFKQFHNVRAHFEEMGWRLEESVGREKLWNEKLEKGE